MGHGHHLGHDHHGHGHSHGPLDPSITRSREGLRVVGVSPALPAATVVVQILIFAATDGVGHGRAHAEA